MSDDEVMRAAQAALGDGRAEEAQNLLYGVVRRDPQNGRAWFLLSEAATVDKHRESYLRKALEAGFDPGPPAEHSQDEALAAARTALAQERMGEVRRLLMPLVESDPQNGEAWFILSQASSLDSQRQLYWQRAWDAGYRYPPPAAPARVVPPPGPRYRAPLDEPLPLFVDHVPEPYYSPPPGQSKAAPDGAGDAFFKGGCFLVLGMLSVGMCAVVAGGGFAIDLGGIACLFVVGGALGVIFYAMRNK